MVRTQISLTEAQMRALRAEAERSGSSIAATMRRALDEYFSRHDANDRRVRLRGIVGIGDSGLGDVAENHDQYAWDDAN